MLVAAIKNQSEYRIKPPAKSINNTTAMPPSDKEAPACCPPQITNNKPRTISGNPAGEIVRKDSQN
tara:strand:- start:2848 stop:3045 length:198 start_codon:yes stop_codon:yes gene_type:complete